MNPALILRGIGAAAVVGAAAVAAAYKYWPRPVDKQPETPVPSAPVIGSSGADGKSVVVVCSVRMADMTPQYLTWNDAQNMPGWGPVARHAFAAFLARNHLPFDAMCRNEITEALTATLTALDGRKFIATATCDDTNNTPVEIAKNRRRAQLRIHDTATRTIYHVWFEFTRHANGVRS